MPRIMLSSGPAFIRVTHRYMQRIQYGQKPTDPHAEPGFMLEPEESIENFRAQGYLRGTAIIVTLPNGEMYQAAALCSPSDNFSRKEGRSRAAKRLDTQLSAVLSKVDRKVVFETIFNVRK